MKVPVVTLLLLSLSAFCYACSSFDLYRVPYKNDIRSAKTSPNDVKFTTGDIISCDITPFASHIFLATSNTTVIHAAGVEDNRSTETRIRHNLFSETSVAYQKCDVKTESFDRKFAKKCSGKPFSTEEVLERAEESYKKFRGNYTHYDKFNCNCEHWVTAWRYGVSFTIQTPFMTTYKSEDCKAPGLMQCAS